ncbi:MAG: hypothetical protein JO262_04970 [Solirubrobacterales bacterium]|nr:hypothetical protein [Solirubrobacterales bacterium]MBV9941464.1 hypothetical protein [Solirubrobacterales bacterium]
MSSEEPALDFDLLAASLRADSSDLSAFVESLAAKLQEAVPTRVRVERGRAGLFGAKTVRSLSVDLGERRFELRTGSGGVQTRCGSLSGGIVLKSEVLESEVWLGMLSEALAVEAQRSAATRRALERLLIQ